MTNAPPYSPAAHARALAAFQTQHGLLRTRDALAVGVHRATLYAMRDAGELRSLGRGLFMLQNTPVPDNLDLCIVARRVPKAVVCLVSALAYHDLTTEIPHYVYCALPGPTRPRIDYPPTRFFRFTEPIWQAGIETHRIVDTPVSIYSVEKTLADCFRYRNRIGTDVAIAALRQYLLERKYSMAKLMEFARLCRVERIMTPYIEAIL
jgi:predicted transcriptional regulator of viral defense system